MLLDSEYVIFNLCEELLRDFKLYKDDVIGWNIHERFPGLITNEEREDYFWKFNDNVYLVDIKTKVILEQRIIMIKLFDYSAFASKDSLRVKASKSINFEGEF